MSEKSIVQEARDIQLAMELITLGARLQMLESETQLSRGRLIKLYKELRGSPPPKGMLPFSTDWFMTWEQNIHASMFCNAWQFLLKTEQTGFPETGHRRKHSSPRSRYRARWRLLDI